MSLLHTKLQGLCLQQATSIRGRSLGAAETGRSVGGAADRSWQARWWESPRGSTDGVSIKRCDIKQQQASSRARARGAMNKTSQKTQHPSATGSFQGHKKHQVWACWIAGKNLSPVAPQESVFPSSRQGSSTSSKPIQPLTRRFCPIADVVPHCESLIPHPICGSHLPLRPPQPTLTQTSWAQPHNTRWGNQQEIKVYSPPGFWVFSGICY